MKFTLTPDEALPVAHAIAKYLKVKQFKLTAEVAAWDDAPYATTLVAYPKNAEAPLQLIEAQSHLDLTVLSELEYYMTRKAVYGGLYVAVADGASLSVAELRQLDDQGVGLYAVAPDGAVKVIRKAVIPALIVAMPPGLRYGTMKDEVTQTLQKFNRVNRKDALRDICELGERLTFEVGIAAIRKGKWTLTAAQYEEKDWSGQIDTLASKNVCTPGHGALCDNTMKTDLQGFRTARNLVDHPAKSASDESRRERQYPDKMLLGLRMVAELLALKRKAARS